MRRTSFVAAALLVAIVACQEATTAPNTPNLSLRFGGENPPPPPIDSGMVGLADGGAGSSSFSLSSTFFFNKTANNGWLSFNTDGVNTAGPNARLHFSNGKLTGKGNVLIPILGGILTLDLGSINPKSTFGDGSCNTEGIADVRGACTNLIFDNQTFTKGGETSTLNVIIRFAPPDPCRVTCDGGPS